MNETYLNHFLLAYPNLQGITMRGNELIYNQESFQIQCLNVEEYLKGNMYIAASLKTMTPQDFFSILKVEEMARQSEKLENQNELQAIQETSPTIKNIGIIKRKDEYGTERTYVHYVDEMGKDHILYQYAPGDVLRTYQELLASLGSSITEKDLFDALKRKMLNVGIDSLENIENAPEEFSSAMDRLNRRTGSFEVKGNAEHQVAVGENNDVYMYEKDGHGNYIHTKYSLNQGEESSFENQDSELQEEEPEKKEEVIFITEQQFYEYIFSEKSLGEEEQQQVDLFYGFLSDVMLYKDYLSEEAKGYLNRYEGVMYQLQIKSNEASLSSQEERVLQKYEEMQEKIKNQELSSEKVNSIQRKLVLPNRDGSFLGVIIVVLTIFLGIVLTFILMK